MAPANPLSTKHSPPPPEAQLSIAAGGCKKKSQSRKECWRGYKLYLDVIDGDIPVSAILTSASLHDSQAAIPLAQMSAGRIVNLYDLADARYDAKEIRAMSARLGHVAIFVRADVDQPGAAPIMVDARVAGELSTTVHFLPVAFLLILSAPVKTGVAVAHAILDKRRPALLA